MCTRHVFETLSKVQDFRRPFTYTQSNQGVFRHKYIYIYTFVSAVDWRVCFPFVISDPTGNFAKRYFCGKISSSIAIFEANSFSLENSYRRRYFLRAWFGLKSYRARISRQTSEWPKQPQSSSACPRHGLFKAYFNFPTP